MCSTLRRAGYCAVQCFGHSSSAGTGPEAGPSKPSRAVCRRGQTVLFCYSINGADSEFETRLCQSAVSCIASVSSSGIKNAVWKDDGEPKKKVLKLGQSAIWRKPLISPKKKDSVLRASLKVPDFTISVYGSSFNNLFLFCLSLASLLSLSMYWHLRQDEMPRNRRGQQETRT